MTQIPASPGDVLAVTGGGWAGTLIRLGEKLAGKPDRAAHVVGITHQDKAGRWIGIQGEPGGVNLVDCTPFLNDPRTSSNHAQPKPDTTGQLLTFLGGCTRSLGIRYDWAGITADISEVLAPDLTADIERLWQWPSDKNILPGHVVCSSLFAMLYDLPRVRWKHPDLGTERVCEPADWEAWNTERRWER